MNAIRTCGRGLWEDGGVEIKEHQQQLQRGANEFFWLGLGEEIA